MLAKLLFIIFLIGCFAWSNCQFTDQISEQENLHFINILTNVTTSSNRRFMDPDDPIIYLLQSTKNRSLDLTLYLQPANRTKDDRLVKRLYIQLEQDAHKANLHSLTMKYAPLQVPIVRPDAATQNQSEKAFDLDPARGILRIPFNSSLILTINFPTPSSDSINDHKELHLTINPMAFDHRLVMVFENASASEFEQKQHRLNELFNPPDHEKRFLKVLSTEQRGRDLQVIFAGFPNFSSLTLTDLIENSCAEQNGQINKAKKKNDVDPLIKDFYLAFDLKLKECSVKMHSVQPSIQSPDNVKHINVWFDQARSGPRSDPSSDSHSARPSATAVLLFLVLLSSSIHAWTLLQVTIVV